MREPSLHIGKQQLTRLISEWYNTSPKVIKTKDLVNYIFRNGNRYSLRHRSILDPSTEILKRTNRLKDSSLNLAMEFSKLATVLRKRLYKNNSLKPITPQDTNQWPHILKATSLASQFSKDFKIPIRQGLLRYIEISLIVIKPFGFNRMVAFDDRIRSFHRAEKEIEADPNMIGTNTIHEIYQQRVFDKTGITFSYRERPEEFVNFVKASAIAKELNIHPKYFIIAQFEQLDFTNSYPIPSQISSIKAGERAIRWLTENGLRVKIEQKKISNRQKRFLEKFIKK